MKSLYFLYFGTQDIDGISSAMRASEDNGIQVLAAYGDMALVLFMTAEEREKLDENFYGGVLFNDAIPHAQTVGMSEKERQIADSWNLTLKKMNSFLNGDFSGEEISWGDKRYTSPGPSSEISAEYLQSLLRMTGLYPPEENISRGLSDQALNYERIRERLSYIFPDETERYHLLRLILSNPELEETIFSLAPEVLEALLHKTNGSVSGNSEIGSFGFTCRRMLGKVSVGVVFVESSRDDEPSFSTADRTSLIAEVQTGLLWLAAQNLTADVSCIIDYQFLMLDINDGVEAWWRPNAVQGINYRGKRYFNDWVGLGNYRNDMNEFNGSDQSFVIFVTPFRTHHFAYTSNQRVVISNKGNFGGWGISNVDAITAHESCHIFGAADEYTGEGTPCSSCFSKHGCADISNMNCKACAVDPVSCVMDTNSRVLCKYTMKMIGWTPPLSFSPPVLSFGSLSVGQSRTLRLQIRNMSRQPFSLFIPGSPEGSVFQFDAFDGEILPGELKIFSFTFTPTNNGIERFVVRIRSSAPGKPHAVGLVGKGPGGF